MSERPLRPWPRRVVLCLGLLEVIAGTWLMYNGFRFGWLAGDSLSNVWGTFTIFAGFVMFIVPGLVLFLRSPVGWLLQALPAFCLLWLLFRALERATR